MSSELRLPLRPGTDHRLVLRVLPPGPPGRPQAIRLALNGIDLGTIDLGTDPAGFGRYEVMLPAAAVKASDNRLELRTDGLTQGASIEGLDPSWATGFVLWYVTITPLPPAPSPGEAQDRPA